MEGQEPIIAAAGRARSMLLCVREDGAAEPLRWQAWRRSLNRAWNGMAPFREADRDAVAAPRRRADRADFVLGYADFALPIAAGARPIRSSTPSRENAHPAFVQGVGATAGLIAELPMSLTLSVGDLTIHRIIEQETPFLPAWRCCPA